MNETLIAILSGGVMVAVVEGVREALTWRRQRKAAKEDKAEEKANYEQKVADSKIEDRLKAIEDRVKAQNEAMRYVLYDRIRYLGQAYISDGEVDFDDRRILVDMHKSYHYGLGANGDLDNLMEEVNHLPLKKR